MYKKNKIVMKIKLFKNHLYNLLKMWNLYVNI